MPGYNGIKVSFQPELHMMHKSRSREVLYPRHYPNGKVGPMAAHQPISHPMFEALRARQTHDKGEYSRVMKSRDPRKIGGDSGYPTFDSLKLLGTENDAHYLDVFMSENAKQHLRYPSDDSDIRLRTRSCSQTSKSNNSKRHSVNVDSIKKTILGSLRSAASDENIYESVEVIQYRKTIEAIKRQNKTRYVPKTGHPLFDYLRVEKVLNPERHHHSRQASNSDGGSNEHSSSGSGDEFDCTKKPNCRFSRKEVLQTSREPKKHHHKESHQHNIKHDSRQTNEAGSESDDDWAIPRPKIMGGAGGARSRRTGATGLMTQVSHEESDSSSKSTGLR